MRRWRFDMSENGLAFHCAYKLLPDPSYRSDEVCIVHIRFNELIIHNYYRPNWHPPRLLCSTKPTNQIVAMLARVFSSSSFTIQLESNWKLIRFSKNADKPFNLTERNPKLTQKDQRRSIAKLINQTRCLQTFDNNFNYRRNYNASTGPSQHWKKNEKSTIVVCIGQTWKSK